MKVLSAIGHQTQDKLFAIIEADDYQEVNDLVRPDMWNDPVEVLPCNDIVALGNATENEVSNPATPFRRTKSTWEAFHHSALFDG